MNNIFDDCVENEKLPREFDMYIFITRRNSIYTNLESNIQNNQID